MPGISDQTVARALAAYESLPEHSGRFERMRAALEAVTRKKPEKKEETGKDGD
jgi:hypothetical protein